MILRSLSLFAAMLLLPFFFLVGPKNLHAFTPQKGMFLVAAEHLPDPRFHQGVVLLIQHDAQGSAGLVINRDSRLTLDKVLAEGAHLPGPVVTLAYGGPLETQTLLALVKIRKDPPEPADKVIGNLYVTGVSVLVDWPDFKREVIDYRAFAGYAGWAPGQLEMELQHGDWQLVPGDAETVFKEGGDQLWERLRNSKPEQN